MRAYAYLIKGIQVELKNPPKQLGQTNAELYGTAEVWGQYADAVSRGSAESIVVSWTENGVVRPHVIARRGQNASKT